MPLRNSALQAVCDKGMREGGGEGRKGGEREQKERESCLLSILEMNQGVLVFCRLHPASCCPSLWWYCCLPVNLRAAGNQNIPQTGSNQSLRIFFHACCFQDLLIWMILGETSISWVILLCTCCCLSTWAVKELLDVCKYSMCVSAAEKKLRAWAQGLVTDVIVGVKCFCQLHVQVSVPRWRQLLILSGLIPDRSREVGCRNAPGERSRHTTWSGLLLKSYLNQNTAVRCSFSSTTASTTITRVESEGL